MADFVKVLAVSDLPNGSVKQVVAAGKQIALANIDGQIFAADDACTHKDCSLGNEGFLEGSAIVCGCHGAKFDAASGKVLALPAIKDLVTYETKIEGEDIFVKI